MIKDKRAGENVLRGSDLDWTIVYAAMLTDGPSTGSVVVLPRGSRRRLWEKISRADVAAWLLDPALSGAHSRREVGITGP